MQKQEKNRSIEPTYYFCSIKCDASNHIKIILKNLQFIQLS